MVLGIDPNTNFVYSLACRQKFICRQVIFCQKSQFFLLTAFSDIWDLWRNLENLHFAFKRYKMNVYGKKISEIMKELANVKRRIFNYRCAS